MVKNEFIDAMKDCSKKYGEVVVQTINKASGSYTGMYIKKPNAPTPVVNLDTLYEKYRNEGVDECLAEIDRVFATHAEDEDTLIEVVKKITDWSFVRDRLTCRFSDNNPGGIYDEFEDGDTLCYITPYINLLGDASTRVTPELLEHWEVEKMDVMVEAAMNDMKRMIKEAR